MKSFFLGSILVQLEKGLKLRGFQALASKADSVRSANFARKSELLRGKIRDLEKREVEIERKEDEQKMREERLEHEQRKQAYLSEKIELVVRERDQIKVILRQKETDI
jgi:hypothetical protein